MISENWDVIVTGAGAAGLFAAAAAASRGRRTLVLEKAPKIGVKILMSGGTRCNITHDCSPREIAARFGHAKKFLEYPVGRLPPGEVIAILNRLGVETKRESTGKFFPVSDSAVDVRDALYSRAVASGATFRVASAASDVQRVDGRFLVASGGLTFACESVILTTGGQSYPGCGTVGDGYAWAERMGHSIVPTHAALVPLVSSTPWLTALSGVTIAHCSAVAVRRSGEIVGKPDTSSLLLTHFGLSGPLAMNLGRWFSLEREDSAAALRLDFLPDIPEVRLLDMWREHARQFGRQNVTSLPVGPLPGRLYEAFLEQAGILPETRLGELGKQPMTRLAGMLKSCLVPIHGTRGFAKAEVTAGGIALEEVDNRTMASRCCPGLFLAGEILDIDGPIGGYNFQAAFSTGHLAGSHA